MRHYANEVSEIITLLLNLPVMISGVEYTDRHIAQSSDGYIVYLLPDLCYPFPGT